MPTLKADALSREFLLHGVHIPVPKTRTSWWFGYD
jgi:hypothetical protein